MEEFEGPSSSVVFINTSETYVPGKDITCIFSVATEVRPLINKSCWVGIFRVGWERTTDFVTRKFLLNINTSDGGSAQFVSGEENLEVAFSSNVVPPANDVDFYQFCFVTGDGNVLGASCPFLISASQTKVLVESPQSRSSSVISFASKDEKNEELEWCPWLDVSEDVDDAIIVHSKTTLLEKSLAKLVEENNKLREEREENTLEIEKFKSYYEDLVEKVSTQTSAIVYLKKQRVDDQTLIESLEEKLSDHQEDKLLLIKEIHGLKAVITGLEEQKSDLKKDMDLLSKDLQISRDKELQKVSQGYENQLKESAKAITELESELNKSESYIADLKAKHKEELTNMSKSFDDILLQLNTQNSNFENMESQKKELTDKIDEMSHTFIQEKRDLNDEIESLQWQIKQMGSHGNDKVKSLQEELHLSQRSVIELETNIQELKNSLAIQSKELEQMKMDQYASIHKQSAELVEIQMELRRTASELDGVKQENSLLKEKCNGHNGARHALQIAYKHTQRQLSSLKEDHESLSHKYQSLSQEMKGYDQDKALSELQGKVEDLKLRLCIGANAYKEKVLQCKLLERKLKRQDSKSPVMKSSDSQVENSAPTSNAKQSADQDLFEERKALVDELQMEIDSKDKMILELQRKLKASEETFKKSMKALTAELVSSKKIAREMEEEILSFRGSRVKDAERPAKHFGTEREPHWCYEEPAPSFSEISGSDTHYRIFYPPSLDSAMENSFKQIEVSSFQNKEFKARGPFPQNYQQGRQNPPDKRCLGDGAVHPDRTHSVKSRQTEPKAGIILTAEKCPVCEMVFPRGTTDVTATNHVNSHFEKGGN